ncbi:kinase-like domain-containing protein [Lyophyllum atratum]|nr:kinase-like domain-containing protein [Lyophyllum atratum]
MSDTHGIPEIPIKSSWLMTRIRGLFHRHILLRVSSWYIQYCDYREIDYPYFDSLDVYVLPFNTIIKWSERIREEEALSMSFAHSLGLPVPRVLSYGDDGSGMGGSIWMTYIPGKLLSQVWAHLPDRERSTIMDELHQCLLRLRACQNPRSPQISSIAGTFIKSFRTCNGVIPPCTDKADFLRYLSPNFRKGREVVFDDETNKVNLLMEMPHSIVFAHGDLYRHNILVQDGHLSGIIDWECAGWLPEYWDYTTMALRGYKAPSSTWHSALYSNPAFRYHEELECEHVLVIATEASFPR